MRVNHLMKKLNVCFTVDEKYIQHFCVAATSLLENNLDIIDRLFLIINCPRSDFLERAVNFLENRYKVNVECLTIDDSLFENFKITHHFSKAAYFRLLLADILPEDVDKVLYLDSDVVVVGKLSDLLDLDFKNEYYLYAVDHKYKEKDVDRLRQIGFKGNFYFNSGVMYINLKKWRQDGISKILIENSFRYKEHILWCDQDVLNITFENQWGMLGCEYNVYDITLCSKNYKILHFVGSSKPWHFMNKHPLKYVYWKYLKMTPFRGVYS